MSSPRFKIVFFVPETAVAACKAAVFAAGAGRYPGAGDYTECAWSSIGMAQFRPGDAANPNIGQVGKLEEVPEVRVETISVGQQVTQDAVAALRKYACPCLQYCRNHTLSSANPWIA
jgi:hypothetical protein